MKKSPKFLMHFILCILFVIESCKRTDETIKMVDGEYGIELEDDSITGIYKLLTCDKAELSIDIQGEKGNILFKLCKVDSILFDGRVQIDPQRGNPESILLDDIEAGYFKDSIVLQNYGNAVDEYPLFKECDDKYLVFVKQVK